MERTSIYGIVLGGGAAIVAIVALILAIGASGGDATAAATRAEAAVASQSTSITNITSDINSLKASVDNIANAEDGMSQNIASLSQDIDGIKDDLAHAQEHEDAHGHSLEDAIAEVQKMEAERHDELSRAIADQRAHTHENSVSEADVQSLVAETADALKMEGGDADAEISAELHTMIDDLRTEIAAIADGEDADVAALAARIDWLDSAIAPAYTQAYVEEAVRRYKTQGRQATLDYYNTMDSVNGDLYLFVLDQNFRIIVHPTVPANIGLDIRSSLGTDITGYNFGADFVTTTEAGKWVSYVYLNPAQDFQRERKHSYLVKYENLIFGSGWYESDVSLHDDPAAYTLAIVEEAIARYDTTGRDAAVEYYNAPERVDGQWYVFIIDENDSIISHPVQPELLGTDVKDIVGEDGYELGAEIASATEAGHWVDYQWPNPAAGGADAPKHSWVVRHDGLIFGSGYYD